MLTSENTLDREEQKNEIRKRYKGISSDEIDVIPAKEKDDFFNTDQPAIVGVYARVSTGDPNQTSSYELQINHYNDEVQKRSNWQLYKIYADEGISGTSLKHREAFKEMIRDCQEHKMNLILTKNISRFARNLVDCISYIRMLSELNPPIGVFFETEHIYTLDDNSEMSLSFLATLAQEESHTKSRSMNTSIEMRFKRGIFLTPPLLGYDKDENGKLVINEHESHIVQLIYFLYLFGYAISDICRVLEKLNCKTKPGNSTWSHGSVSQILQNERYCGDIIAHKSFTPNYLDHKSKKNEGEKPMYQQKDHHDPIIDRNDWLAVQKKLRHSRTGRTRYLPSIKVVPDGILRGYILLNPEWSGFLAETYIAAHNSVAANPPNNEQTCRQEGDFDLSRYKIVHAEYFYKGAPLDATLSIKHTKLRLNTIKAFYENPCVELLFNPVTHMLAVRTCSETSGYLNQWCKYTNSGIRINPIQSSSYMPIIYKLMNWNVNYQYRATGYCHHINDETIILFHLDEARVLIREFIQTVQPENETPASSTKVHSKYKTGYPNSWPVNFGQNYYEYLYLSCVTQCSPDDLYISEAISYEDEELLSISSEDAVIQNIKNIASNLAQQNPSEVSNGATTG